MTNEFFKKSPGFSIGIKQYNFEEYYQKKSRNFQGLIKNYSRLTTLTTNRISFPRGKMVGN